MGLGMSLQIVKLIKNSILNQMLITVYLEKQKKKTKNKKQKKQLGNLLNGKKK